MSELDFSASAVLQRMRGSLKNDANRISFDQLDRICEALGCDLSELLEYIPNQQPRTGENLILEEHGNRRKKTS